MYPSHCIVTHKYMTSFIVFKILCAMLLTNSQIKIFRKETVVLITLLSTGVATINRNSSFYYSFKPKYCFILFKYY